MKITILIENNGSSHYKTEHGLAVHINFNGKNYLLDAGASDAFILNANRLGIDLQQVDTAVLSHAHYDHSGGFEAFLQLNKEAKIYLREEGKQAYYAKTSAGERYNGIPKGLLSSSPNRFVFVNSDYQLDENVWLIGHKTSGLESRGKLSKLYQMKNGELVPDNFAHEQSMVFDTAKGLVIINSCSHGGIDNIVTEVKAALPGKNAYAVVGGFHLMGPTGTKTLGVSETEIRQLAEKLREQNVQRIYIGHCTGAPAYEIMRLTLGERVQHLHTGTVIEI